MDQNDQLSKLAYAITGAQILNYLKATSMPLGILVNFGTPRAEIERYENWHLLKK